MSSKKWVLVFLVTVFVLAALLAGLNLAADPFGAFGRPHEAIHRSSRYRACTLRGSL